jgi:multiple sugar transport system permease protein
MISTSFKPAPEIISRPPALLPVEITLKNFQNVFKRVSYFQSLFNSVFVATVTTAITIFFSTMVGYGIAKFKSRGLNIVLYLVLSALMLPPFLVAIPLYIVSARIGVINSLWAVIIPFGISNFGIFLMRQFCVSVPDDLLAAARIDGASEFSILIRVVFPVVSSGCAALGILKFLMTWNDFFYPLIMLTNEKKMTLQIMLSTFIDFEYYMDFGLVMALTTLIVLPVILLFVIFQRYIIEGVTLSGIKG